MKTLHFIIVLVFVFVLNQTVQSQAYKYIEESMNRLISKSEKMTDYEFELNNSAILGGWIEEGKELAIINEFKGYQSYAIFAYGDNSCSDLDIVFEDRKGNELVRDNLTDNYPIVYYTPTSTDNYTIRMKNVKSKGKVFCVYAIMRKGSNNYESINRLKLAYKRFKDLGINIPGEYSFVNDGCILGGLYSEGKSDGFYGNYFNISRYYTFFVAGSYNVDDVDCEIVEQFSYDNTSGTTVLKDDSKTSTAICTAYLKSGKYYYFKYINSRSQGNGFIFGGIMYRKQI